MITLIAHDLCWIKGSLDDSADQCAHAHVEFHVNGTTFLSPKDGEWTVSAAALYLLRTITLDHSESNPIAEGNFLFPCCAFNAWPIQERFKVVCIGCTHGIDINITHSGDSVVIESDKGKELVSEFEWRDAVLAFVKQVREFYDRSSPKDNLNDEFDREGWVRFWSEWNERNLTNQASEA
jgi:hypothetical protein